MVDKQEVERINRVMAENKLRVAYFRKPGLPNNGGTTVVWKEEKRGRLFYISTAVCSEKDQFSKQSGRVLAVQMFEKGNCIGLMSDGNDSYNRIFNIFYNGR